VLDIIIKEYLEQYHDDKSEKLLNIWDDIEITKEELKSYINADGLCADGYFEEWQVNDILKFMYRYCVFNLSFQEISVLFECFSAGWSANWISHCWRCLEDTIFIEQLKRDKCLNY
jgi:hypothetical protein